MAEQQDPPEQAPETEPGPPAEAASPEGGPADPADAGEGGAGEPRSDTSPPPGRGGCGLWFVLVAAALLVGLQAAGILLRDPLEGRRPLTTTPRPLPQGETAEAPQGSRFGPGVTEVTVAPAKPPEAPGRQETPPAGPQPPAPAVKADASPKAPEEDREAHRAEPRPASPVPPAPSPPAAAPARPYALQVGMFRSQAYREEMEARLRRLGLPVFLRRTERPSKGFRVAVEPGADPSAARAALAEAGYEVEAEGETVAFFYLEGEAKKAAGILGKRGVPARVEPYEGPFPVWTVYAGPFTREEAEGAKTALAREEIRAYLREGP